MEGSIGADTVDRITRAFDSAFLRFREARTVGDQEDEASNLLHHLYRLATAIHGEPERGAGGWSDLEGSGDVLATVPALIQLRHVDVHVMIRTAEMRSVYPQFYTGIYGTLVWSLSASSFPNKRLIAGAARYRVIELLNGQGVAGTLFDARHALIA